jgi:DNA-binding Xre family transcriptional regulator
MSAESDEETRARLNEVMANRALDLDLRWNQVATRAGMTYSNLHRIRTGQIAITSRAARGIDRALEWQPGSVEGILSGREPVPIDAAPDRVDPAREELMEKHKIDTRLFGLAEADRRLEQDIAEINAARERTSSRSSERPESA